MSQNTPVVKVLKAAKKLIADPRHWTKGTAERIADDGSIQYCMIGAVLKAIHPEQSSQWTPEALQLQDKVIPLLRDVTGMGFVTKFNDHPNTVHTDVMVAFDKAIRWAKSDGI